MKKRKRKEDKQCLWECTREKIEKGRNKKEWYYR